MSESCNSPKPQRTDQDVLHQTGTTPSKRQKPSEFPASQSLPAFWNNLSKFWLTRCALRELNRRNRQLSGRLPYSQTRRPVTRNSLAAWKRDYRSVSDILDSCTAEALKDIGQSARHEGPDISNLRGVRISNSSWLALVNNALVSRTDPSS